jgi:uncharacterized protein (DUF1015 family)
LTSINPFRPYRYTAKAGPIEELVTQPYDKITPDKQARYLALNPHNVVRVILGERSATDNEQENVYTRSAAFFKQWIAEGILEQDSEPGLFAYFQEFAVPDTGERLVRKGFIGLGPVEEYSAGIVHRHEQTLTGPKKDRQELLRHTKAHFGQIFVLYPDRNLAIEPYLDEAAVGAPLIEVVDEYGTVNRLWRIPNSTAVQKAMEDKKLLIADGHHRYETALAYRNQNPNVEGANRVMMTFVNMYSPGLRILATHRVVRGLADLDKSDLGGTPLPNLDALKRIFFTPAPDRLRMGIAVKDALYLVDRPRQAGEQDVTFLHDHFLRETLNIDDEAVRNESHLEYVRSLDTAYDRVHTGAAQVAFLLEPTPIEQVAEVAFSGGVMPQKSTDFYPKLLTGLTIYKVEA